MLAIARLFNSDEQPICKVLDSVSPEFDGSSWKKVIVLCRVYYGRHSLNKRILSHTLTRVTMVRESVLSHCRRRDSSSATNYGRTISVMNALIKLRKAVAPVLTALALVIAAGVSAPAQAAAVSNTVTIHYNDPDATGFASYKDWALHMWINGTSTDSISNPNYFNGSDSFGKKLTFTIQDSAGVTSIGVIVKNGNWDKIGCANCAWGADRLVALNPSGTTEVWIQKGNDAQYSTSAPTFTPASWGANDEDPYFSCTDGVCEPAKTYPDSQKVIIHYSRPTATGFGDYKDWNLWMWLNGKNGPALDSRQVFNGSDSFGKKLTLNLTGTTKISSVSAIVRTDSWAKDGCANCSGDGNADRTFPVSEIVVNGVATTEVWITSGAADAFSTSLPADYTPAPWAEGAVDPNVPTVYPATQKFILHYNRPAGDYTGWNIWAWNNLAGGSAKEFTSTDSFGKVLTWDVTNAKDVASYSFIVRTDNWDKDTPDDRTVLVNSNGNGTTEIWVRQGASSFTSSDPFVKPTISAISAVKGGPGTSVVITGTNMTYVNSVKFGTKAAPAVVIDATHVLTSVPAAAGTTKVGLTVGNPEFTSNVTTGTLMFTPSATLTAPKISTVPANGSGGNTYNLTGTNLGGVTKVTLGGVELSSFKVKSATSLDFTVPEDASNDGKLAVTTAGGVGTSSKSFYLRPIIGHSTSAALIGDTIAITGSFLGAASKVTLAGKTISTFTKSGTAISFTVPANAVTGVVVITTPGGTATTASVVITPVPVIKTITGTLKVGSTITITGTGLSGATVVKVGTTTITNFSVVSSTSITFTASAAVTGAISVTTPGGKATRTTSTVIKA